MINLFYTREFFYREKRNFDDFFLETWLWKRFYDFFRNSLSRAFSDDQMLIDFNEACFQYRAMMYGLYPDEEIENCCLRDSHKLKLNDFGLYRMVDWELVWIVLYALLAVQNNLPQPLLKLLRFYDKVDFIFYEELYEETRVFVKQLKESSYDCSLRSFPIPESPEFFFNKTRIFYCEEKDDENRKELYYNAQWWKVHTNDFDKATIEELVQMWTSTDRLEIILLLHSAYCQHCALNNVKGGIDEDMIGLLAKLKADALADIEWEIENNDEVCELSREVCNASLREAALRADMDGLWREKGKNDFIETRLIGDVNDRNLRISELEAELRRVKNGELEAENVRLKDELEEKEKEIARLQEELANRSSGSFTVHIENMNGTVVGDAKQEMKAIDMR